ncbi:MAG: ATP-dependent Clp protease ATP-binding subunit, partial [Candidatus Omnitrophica bacterium]|nr:ATP-dependent Clp protease ATP-binding subunit [Candidatus Omnitrophota bacterium]
NILLQVFEEGRLTDSLGRKIDFRNTIIIMTSNVGAEMLRSKGALGFVTPKEGLNDTDTKSRLLEEVKKFFKPEFLNRIDDIIVFKSLTRENLTQIVTLEIREVTKRLEDKQIAIEVDQPALDLLVEKGFDPVFGARPLKRTIQRLLEDPLAEEIISGRYKEGSKVKITRKNDALYFE